VDDGAAAPDLQDHHVLIVTDAEQGGYGALSLPFRHAEVIEVESGREADLHDMQGAFDAIVIDRKELDLAWLEATALKARSALRSGGHLIVVLSRQATIPDTVAIDSTPRRPGLEWEALREIGGWPAAVLRSTSTPAASPAAGVVVAAVDAAVRLAVAGTTASGDRAVEMLTRQMDTWRRSDLALLAQIDDLVRYIEEIRRQHRGFELAKTVLRRSRSGRLLIRLLRPMRRLAHAVVARPFRMISISGPASRADRRAVRSGAP
jgi:hypothetical protein